MRDNARIVIDSRSGGRPGLWLAVFVLAGFASATTLAAASRERNELRSSPATNARPAARLIVGLADAASSSTSGKLASRTTSQALKAIAGRAALAARGYHGIGHGLGTIELARALAGAELDDAMAKVASDPAVAFVQVDRVKQPHALSDDPLATGQWFLGSDQIAAIRATTAWDTTQGSDGIVVAVLDTGVVFDHPDIGWAAAGGRFLPGYDFVGADGDGRFLRANDGDGRDPNPWDPGDWISDSDLGHAEFSGCATSSSSWHGTRVSGLIAALTNNALGVAGVTWKTWILPVRVLGKCGGSDSDILAAMSWAGGLPVDGVPANPHPAQIINLSLGSGASCTSAYRSVVSQLVSRGVVVVASAGNDGSVVSEPADCPGAVAVAAVRHVGTKVGFSNLGPEVSISAPGGNCVNTGAGEPCLYSIDTTSNAGGTTPGANTYTDQFDFNVGTSFSAPLVSGVAALARGINARLPAATLRARLEEGSSPFPVNTDPDIPQCHVPSGPSDIQTAECACTTDTCGAGLLNADGAVRAASRPIATPRVTSAVTAGQEVTLAGAGSVAACGRAIAGYSWTLVGDDTGAIVGADQPNATIIAPASGVTIVRLTVTDDHGAMDSADVTVTSSSASTNYAAPLAGDACAAPVAIDAEPAPEPDLPPASNPDPAPSGGGGGGGGGGGDTDPWVLLALACAGAVVRRRRWTHAAKPAAPPRATRHGRP